MRFLTILTIISGLTASASAKSFDKTEQDSLKTSKQNDDTGYKTILIGNVTEFSYGTGWFNPEKVWGGSESSFSNSRVSTWSLTQYLIINNFLIQSGLEYNTTKADYAFEFRWDSIATRQVWINDTINTHYYISDGDSIAEHVIDRYLVNKTDTLEKVASYESKNRISSVTIPLNFGYRWRFNKIALYLKMGARFNFITDAKGKIVISEGRIWQDFNKEIEKKFYYSAATSVEFEYLLADFGSLILEPEYRYSWYSRVNPDFVNNYHQFGIKLGVQIWF